MQHAKSRNLGATGKFSLLDWPTPELLLSARRARGRAVREMISALCHSLGSLTMKSMPKAEASPDAARSAT